MNDNVTFRAEADWTQKTNFPCNPVLRNSSRRKLKRAFLLDEREREKGEILVFIKVIGFVGFVKVSGITSPSVVVEVLRIIVGKIREVYR